MTEHGYISEDQQTHTQPKPEQKRQQERASSGLRRLQQVGAVMAVLLAADLGFIAAGRTSDKSEPEIHPQTVTDVFDGIGNFDTPSNPPTTPQTPTGWSMVIPNPAIPPIYDQNGPAFSPPAAVEVITYGTGPCESNGWLSIDSNVNPGQTYTLNFEAAYTSSTRVNPKIILDWKNSSGQSLNSPDVYTFTNIDANGNTVGWRQFTRTYGTGQNAVIPQEAAKVSAQIEGDVPPDLPCSGVLHYDNISMTTTEPTPPPSVGGIAEMPNLPPAATVSHSSRNTIMEFALAGATVLAGTIAVAEAVRRRKQ